MIAGKFHFDIGVGPGTGLSVTTPGAERVYRSLGPAAQVDTTLHAAEGSTLHWLPQETILFDHSSLHRRFDVNLAGSANLLAVEAVVFGRTEMGETISQVELRDSWRIRRDGRLIHADDTAIAGTMPATRATLAGAGAMALIIYVSATAERALDGVRAGNVIAFGVEGYKGKETVIVVAEVRTEDPAVVREAIHHRTIEVCGLPPRDVMLVRAGTLPKTSSGKLQRAKCRELYMNEELELFEPA